MKWNLTPRATVALSTAAVSLFLLVCFAGYGSADAAAVAGPGGFSGRIASFFVTPLGAGAHVLALLAFAWGVIVYFQERTPDLVLRLVGTTTLAASTAMVVGLLHVDDGQRSVWAGAVGTAAARTFASFGTFGTVLGWFAATSLFFVSFVFATDSLFRTLRRGDRAAFDPKALPTEPSRGDLLEDPALAEPREFVRETSRAAAFVPEIQAEAPQVALVEPARLPDGFSADVEESGRTVVRGPQGYGNVEFLPPSDELAVPEAPRPDEHRRVFAGMLDDEVAYTHTHGDPVLDDAEPAPYAAADDEIADAADADDAAHDAPTTSPAEESDAGIPREEPRSGIALADASLLVDEVFTFGEPVAFSEAYSEEDGAPHDGGSAVHEIAAALAPAPVAEAPAADEAGDGAGDDDTGEVAPRFEDDVLVAPSPVLEDEVIFAYDEPSDALVPSAPSVPEATHVAVETRASAAVAELAAPVLGDVPALHVSEETTGAGLTDAELASLRAALVLAEEPAAAPAATVAPEPVALTSQLARAEEDVPAPESPLFEVVAAAPAAVEELAAPAETPVAAVETPADPAEAATAPVVVAAAPAVETPVAEAPAAQLTLFVPTCDLSKLATMELDPLFHDAAKAVLARGRASAVVLQRALGIGYARGLRILDQMTEAGMVGPDSPGGAREILYTQADWDAFAAR